MFSEARLANLEKLLDGRQSANRTLQSRTTVESGRHRSSGQVGRGLALEQVQVQGRAGQGRAGPGRAVVTDVVNVQRVTEKHATIRLDKWTNNRAA